MPNDLVGPLRVLLVHECFPPDFRGGGEYVVLETARHLRARGHDVRVLTTGNPQRQEILTDVSITRLPISRYRMNFATRAVAQHAHDVDVVHAFTYHATYPAYRAAKRLGMPVVGGVLALFGDVWREMRGPVAGRVFERLEARLLRLPLDARVYLSEASRDSARTLAPESPADVVIEPGISLSDYAPKTDRPYVMFSGKLDVRKGIDVVLAVARQLPDIPFRIVGWGDRFAEVTATAPPNVAVEPFRDRLHLADALSHARIFLFPTKAETFGLIVAEAMASGCAIVSSSSLPFAGARIDAGDAAAAVGHVRKLWGDSERCGSAGAANVQRAQRYSWPLHVEALERVYRNVIAQKARRT